MRRAGLGDKTGRRMGHMPISGTDGAIDRLGDARDRPEDLRPRQQFEPGAARPDSAERQEAERAGWRVAAPGMEVRP